MKINKSSGKISKILIILAIIVIIAIVAVYAVIKITENKKLQAQKLGSSPMPTSEAPKPIYDVTIGDVRFLLQSARDLGGVLERTSSYQQDLTTTEKFIEVVIGAQNKGKNNIAHFSWDVGNIVDSDGRNFLSINDRAYQWLPKPDLCGSVLKPEFEPVPCVKIYEVSKISTNLKVGVRAGDQNASNREELFIDLKITR